MVGQQFTRLWSFDQVFEQTSSNSHYETDFGVSSVLGAGNTKIGFLKARQRRAFKKPIFINRIAGRQGD
ncbi:hypothetical protein B9G53_03310 [Pseudanabaena sp. SR411]|uniref:hypothetical protein n=1 Tax=Pseudanabaena sp. SR411 TaxID=1980935 RepID=UPI000B97E922|nr:hypothetical protein [Pseudanabaena sp. SR411]OYQ66767.1 hypothetical protein B9G53_03310 [Pseudanabaena sp. SR411]